MIRLIPVADGTRGTPSCVIAEEGPIIVWVGLDRDAVNQLVNDCGQGVGDQAIINLRAMVNDGDIDISREYMVTATVIMSGTVSHTVDAVDIQEASETVMMLIKDGLGLDDFYGDVDDVSIEDVEEC